MDKLKQQMKDSGDYEYSLYSDHDQFDPHKYNEVGVQFIRTTIEDVKQQMEHIEIIRHDKITPEGYVIAKIYVDMNLLEFENILFNLFG